MTSHFPRHDLLDAFRLLTRVERGADAGAVALLEEHLDEWLRAYPELPPTVVGGGAGRGYPVLVSTNEEQGPGQSPAAWLMPGGEILLTATGVPDGLAPAARRVGLADAAVPLPAVAATVRRAMLTEHLGEGWDAGESGPVLQAQIADVLDLAWDADAAGRAAIYDLVVGSMRDSAAWRVAAARLQAGLERGLTDRAPDVRRTATRGVLAMALGGGPMPAAAKPSRLVRVLFAVPREDVHIEALEAMHRMPEAALEPIEGDLPSVLERCVVADSAQERRLAADLLIKLEGRTELEEEASALVHPDPEIRLTALDEIRRSPDQGRQLLPHLLDALSDSDARVRRAAVDVLRPLLTADPDLRLRILAELLEAPADEPMAAGMALVEAKDLPSPRVQAAFRAALNRPGDHRDAALALLIRYEEGRGMSAAATALTELLHHPDAEMRLAALDELARHPPDQLALREDLLQPLADHLRHPDRRLRIAAARCFMAMGFAHAHEMVGHLALDPDPEVRAAVLEMLRLSADDPAYRGAAQRASAVSTLLGPVGEEGDERLAWLAALAFVQEDPSDRATATLAAAVAALPATGGDEFVEQALDELDRALVERTGGGEGLVVVCRHLLERRPPQGEHAARLAGRIAAEHPGAVDFLWTLYTHASGSWAEAARRALAELGGQTLAPDVEAELRGILDRTGDASRRDVLKTLLGL